jgi:mono/diheme cytochrome c family protein
MLAKLLMSEGQSWLPMREMKSKVTQRRLRSFPISAQELVQESLQESAKPSDQRSAGAAPAHPRPAGDRENIVSRLWRFSPWVLAALAAAPFSPAAGQNLDAGKSGSQIFAEVCSNCHRSPRELRSNAGTSFLREHYTTGSDMASTMSAYLSGAGGGAGNPQQRRPPNPTAPGTATTTRDTPPVDPSRDPRRAQQAAEPKASAPPPTGPGSARGRPASATAEIKPSPAAPPAPAPARPPLEEFEE